MPPFSVASFHRIARPRQIFSTFPLRCMSPSASATRRTKSLPYSPFALSILIRSAVIEI
jgi:hypothetical protein